MAVNNKKVRNLLSTLISGSEKAANIARKCRSDPALLNLLIQQKSENEANPRFLQDFKTLADVLIQETLRNDVAKMFPEMKDNIKGEETDTFTNQLGQSITVDITDDLIKTTKCLELILNGDTYVAETLAKVVHEDINHSKEIIDIPNLPTDFDYKQVGIWIDPIDSTSEYIAGDTIFTNFPGITSSGLDCVTVLIGVYEINSGKPIIGVINQPFHKKNNENSYNSSIYWGICFNNIIQNNISLTNEQYHKIAILSTTEKQNIKDKLKEKGFELAFSAGAGHKSLKVITQEADLYIISKGTTFKWDTCAAHAILKSMGGAIYDFNNTLKEKKGIELTYHSDNKCNNEGIIAIQNLLLLPEILEIFE